ncbi:hypothetical protein G6F68_011354 [Rhizopus microsporus]|nr:hypothetical protein G6F68_011354 [Rhizopus microsporus]
MPPFTTLKGYAAPLDISNVDTDMIIPKQFLKTIKRTGLGSALFYALRFDPQTGQENPTFVLNQAPFRQARLLVCTGPNFGCGSSREHAPWAFNDFGIRCILAPSFADIFFNNCFKNGMLPIVLPQAQLEAIAAEAQKGVEVEVDLVQQIVRYPGGEVSFDVEEFRKHCLVNGLDDIGLTMQKADKIAQFEAFCARERCPYAVVGVATAEKRLIVRDPLLNNVPIDLPMPVLFGKPPKMSRKTVSEKPFRRPFDTTLQSYLPGHHNLLAEAASRVLHLPAVASKSFLVTIGDRSITAMVARDQFVGPWQVPVADVAVTTSSLGLDLHLLVWL